MGRKVQEFRPNVVLATAIYSGLSSLVWLAEKRKNSQTKAIYKKIHDMWETVQEEKKNRQTRSFITPRIPRVFSEKEFMSISTET